MADQKTAASPTIREWGKGFTAVIAFRCGPALRDRIFKAAEDADLTPSEWIRIVVEAVLDAD